jgi:surface antigen
LRPGSEQAILVTTALWLLSYLGVTTPTLASDIRLECVPFARAEAGIELYGDAWLWWSQAAGRYERGYVPQLGSVLSFRSGARMPLGHVAVVAGIIGSRRIKIDHANWDTPGRISRSAQVLDVSPRNDWTAVRVEGGEGNDFGAVYATNGFIYRRPSELRLPLVNYGDLAGAGPSDLHFINIAEALRQAEARSEIVNVAQALNGRSNDPHIINVAQALGDHRDGIQSLDMGGFRRSSRIVAPKGQTTQE